MIALKGFRSNFKSQGNQGDMQYILERKIAIKTPSTSNKSIAIVKNSTMLMMQLPSICSIHFTMFA